MSEHDEEQLIGELLNRPDLLPDVQAAVGLNDFASDEVARAFEWLCGAKLSTDASANIRDFSKWARREGVLAKADAAGSPLLRIIAVPTGAHCAFHATAVANAAAWRRLASVADSMASCLRMRDTEGEVGAEAALREAAERIGDALVRSSRGDATHISGAMTTALAEIESRLSGQRRIGLETGFVGLDRLLSGLRPGQLVILAARPGQGKSALAANMAANICGDGGRVLFVSLEMSRDELSERLLASHAGVDCGRMKQGNLKPSERTAIVESATELSRWEMAFDDRSSLRVHDIVAQARRMQMRGGLDLVVVDYIQLLTPDDRRVPRQEQVASFSRGLKQAAKSLGVPVLCCAQLNREADSPLDRPKLSNLRESGALEQDADVVLFIWHDQGAGKAEHGKPSPCEIIVAKQRSGPTGSVACEWRGDVVTFSERQPERCAFLPKSVEPTSLFEPVSEDGWR